MLRERVAGMEACADREKDGSRTSQNHNPVSDFLGRSLTPVMAGFRLTEGVFLFFFITLKPRVE